MLKIKNSNQEENLYIVYRVVFPFRLKKIGTVRIVPNRYYTFMQSSEKGIKPKELHKLQEKCRKLAKMNGEHISTDIW